MFHSVR